MVGFVLVLVTVGVIITIHELGHLGCARLTGIPVRRFSLGFGPVLWRFRRGSTEYCLSLIPFGGYIVPAFDDVESYFRVPAMKRVVLAMGGPAANFVLAVLCLAAIGVYKSGFSLETVLVAPVVDSARMFLQILMGIPDLFSSPEKISGPLGIVAEGGRLVGVSGLKAVFLAAFLSMNFCILNLLPLPVLDGGKLLLVLFEKVHPAMRRAFVPLTLGGAVLLIGLTVYATVNDIGRILG